MTLLLFVYDCNDRCECESDGGNALSPAYTYATVQGDAKYDACKKQETSSEKNFKTQTAMEITKPIFYDFAIFEMFLGRKQY